MSVINVENLSYRYKKGKKNVLENLSCEFQEGEVTAIIGSSGSGKSTLLSLLAGLDHPTGGTIKFENVDLQNKNLDDYRRTDVSMIFQSFELFSMLTAIENVCYPMELNGIDIREAKEKASELLEKVGIIKEKQERYPSQLSGGEQQRVAIARSLASGSKVILADEPTGNLDEESTQNIINSLEYLAHEQGICVIIVTHDMEVAERADKVLRLVNGKLE